MLGDTLHGDNIAQTMSTDRSTQHSASQNGENGGGGDGGSKCLVLQTGAWWRWWESAAAWCSFSTMSWSYYQMQWMEPAACQDHCSLLSPADILFRIWLWASTRPRWWHNGEIEGWEPEDESWAAILQPSSSIYQGPGPEPDIIGFTLHPPSPDYHHHHPPTQRWRRRRFVALISDFLWWMLNHARSGSVQSQFMLKSSTQIMFKQMQTKFVGKPLLHFPQNLIKTLKID